jgi:hypothetical protein
VPLNTFALLQTAITEYAMRQGDAEFIARCPDFVALAEKRITRLLRVGDMETTATVVLTDGIGSLPADYVAFRRVLALTSPAGVLELISPDDAETRFPNETGGQPSHFTIIGTTVKTYPLSAANLRLTYYASPVPLSDAAPSNWLLTKHPDLYLYGALMEGAVFMKDDQELARWGALFEKAMRDVQGADVRARMTRFSARRIGLTP